MASRPPRFVYFDMGNVLLFFSHERQAEQVGRVAGLAPADVLELLYRGYRDRAGLHWAAECGQAPPTELHARFCDATRTQPERRAFELASNEIFWPNTAVAPLVAQLRIAGFRLGVLSNTSEGHWEYCLARYRVMELFHVHALSFRLGAMKPDERIYAEAARLAGVQPDEIFFTDDRSDNVAAAQQAGWDAVVFESARQLYGELARRGIVLNY
jgi:HAD superfamily hydrolase (TIGR01509 family)